MSIPNAHRKAHLPRETAFQREIKKPSRVGYGYASFIGYISITSGGCFCFYSEILIVFRRCPGEILGGKKRFAAVKAVKLAVHSRTASSMYVSAMAAVKK